MMEIKNIVIKVICEEPNERSKKISRLLVSYLEKPYKLMSRYKYYFSQKLNINEEEWPHDIKKYEEICKKNKEKKYYMWIKNFYLNFAINEKNVKLDEDIKEGYKFYKYLCGELSIRGSETHKYIEFEYELKKEHELAEEKMYLKILTERYENMTVKYNNEPCDIMILIDKIYDYVSKLKKKFNELKTKINKEKYNRCMEVACIECENGIYKLYKMKSKIEGRHVGNENETNDEKNIK